MAARGVRSSWEASAMKARIWCSGAFAHFEGGVHVIEQLVEGVAHGTHFGARVGISRLHAHRRGDGVLFQVQVRHIGCHGRDSLQGFMVPRIM